ncbi:hypothetical protein GC194_06220 [bacterium]|nr:hypothetical protein [bacterium]
MDKIELRILGISSGHTAASYTLILEEMNGERKLPVVIGAAEAQSIAVQIEGIKPVRPMTHDLMKDVLGSFSVKVQEVIISKLEEGIFYADLVVTDGTQLHTIDARTSDAIALALRFNCPIFTYEKILNEAGIILTDKESEQLTSEAYDDNELDEEIDDMIDSLESDNDLGDLSVSELEKMLDEAINEENYDLAARIRDEINSRK